MYDDNGEETFERSGNYTWFADYSDDQWSYIDKNKDIQLDANQINITQESNSQVIPFEMPRYYDGIDLLQMTIQIHYLNADRLRFPYQRELQQYQDPLLLAGGK